MQIANLKLKKVPSQEKGLGKIVVFNNSKKELGAVHAYGEFTPTKNPIMLAEMKTIMLVMENFGFFFDNLQAEK